MGGSVALMTMLGRAGGMALLEKAFAADGYSKEDLQDVAEASQSKDDLARL